MRLLQSAGGVVAWSEAHNTIPANHLRGAERKHTLLLIDWRGDGGVDSLVALPMPAHQFAGQTSQGALNRGVNLFGSSVKLICISMSVFTELITPSLRGNFCHLFFFLIQTSVSKDLYVAGPLR